jgi:FSR family fosmidomycin resistance protein-like MFS transporter
LASESTQKTEIHPKSTDHDFQNGKILALSIGHFIHDVYSSFLAPLLPLGIA